MRRAAVSLIRYVALVSGGALGGTWDPRASRRRRRGGVAWVRYVALVSVGALGRKLDPLDNFMPTVDRKSGSTLRWVIRNSSFGCCPSHSMFDALPTLTSVAVVVAAFSTLDCRR